MNEQLIANLEAEAKQLKSRLDHLRIERANSRLRFNQWREFFTTKEKLHAIYLKLRNPDALVVYDIKVTGFRLPPGANTKALTDALEARGFKWEIDFETRTVSFYRRYGWMTFPPRTYDVAVVKGSAGSATMMPSELKTPNALINSVKGKLGDGTMLGEFKTRSGRTKLVGGQIETEKWLRNLAREHGVEAVLLESSNIENGFYVKHEIKPDNLKVSRVTPYKAPSTKLFSSARVAGRRIQRNLERARQRQARESAARKAADPRSTSDKGTSNKLGKPTRQVTQAGRRIASRVGKTGGRILRKWVGLALTVLDAKWGAEEAVRYLRRDLAEMLSRVNPEIEKHQNILLESEENLEMFEALPFHRYWFEIRVTLQTKESYEENRIVIRHTDIALKSVDIVLVRGREGYVGEPVQVGDRTYQEYVEYQLVFEELTRGERLLADGYRLTVIDYSHGGPKGEERLQVIYDYIVFAKAYPQLAEQYQHAWKHYRDELCMAGFRDLFTESEIEACRDREFYEELSKERGTALQPNLIDAMRKDAHKAALDRYLLRIAPSQKE